MKISFVFYVITSLSISSTRTSFPTRGRYKYCVFYFVRWKSRSWRNSSWRDTSNKKPFAYPFFLVPWKSTSWSNPSIYFLLTNLLILIVSDYESCIQLFNERIRVLKNYLYVSRLHTALTCLCVREGICEEESCLMGLLSSPIPREEIIHYTQKNRAEWVYYHHLFHAKK